MSPSLPGTEAGLRLNGSAPAVWQFVSDAQRNAFGQPRGYAVAFTGELSSCNMPEVLFLYTPDTVIAAADISLTYQSQLAHKALTTHRA